MPGCAVKHCKNYDTKVQKIHGITYHRFPHDPERKAVWRHIIQKQRKDPSYKPAQNARVCSAHFDAEDFITSKAGLHKLKKSAVPRIVSAVEEREYEVPVETIEVDISDLGYVFDTPREEKFRKRAERLKTRLTVAAKKVKNLQKQNRRLQIRCKFQADIIKELRQENKKIEEVETVFNKNVEIAELYRLRGIINKFSA